MYWIEVDSVNTWCSSFNKHSGRFYQTLSRNYWDFFCNLLWYGRSEIADLAGTRFQIESKITWSAWCLAFFFNNVFSILTFLLSTITLLPIISSGSLDILFDILFEFLLLVTLPYRICGLSNWFSKIELFKHSFSLIFFGLTST